MSAHALVPAKDRFASVVNEREALAARSNVPGSVVGGFRRGDTARTLEDVEVPGLPPP